MRTNSGLDASSEDQDVLGLLKRHLLPTPAVSPPKATPIPSDREQLIQCLMGTDHPVRPVSREHSSIIYLFIYLFIQPPMHTYNYIK